MIGSEIREVTFPYVENNLCDKNKRMVPKKARSEDLNLAKEYMMPSLS